MSGIKLANGTPASAEMTVDTDGNAHVNVPADSLLAGFVTAACESDAGDVTGTRRVLGVDITQDYRVRVGVDTPWFNEWFPGAALNTALWRSNLTSMTVTVSGGLVTLNAGASVTTTNSANVSTYRSFPIYGTFPLTTEIRAQFKEMPQANNIVEWGLGVCAATTPWAPTDGCFFRLTSASLFQCVVSYSGSETVSSSLDFAALVGTDTTRHFVIQIDTDEVIFWVDDVIVAVVSVPAGVGPSASGMLPLFARVANVGAVSSAQQIRIAFAGVNIADAEKSKPWADVLCGAGGMSSQGQTGGTMGSTALYTNSLAAGAGAAATNTTAALGSGLGGQFALQPTLAAGTDGIISSYQVPLGTAALPGKTLYITGIYIAGLVTAALTGGPVLGAWSLGYGNTAVSLATAEGAATKASRRVPLGIMTFPVTAAVGTIGTGVVSVQFASPIVVQPGEFVQTIMKNLGTVTSAGVIVFLVSVNGYFE